MAFDFYFHPLASFCWKPLIALYEMSVPFTPQLVDLGDDDARAEYAKIWPTMEFPVLVDKDRGETVAQSASVVEYAQAFGAPTTSMIPDDPDAAWKVRMWDRIFDDYLQLPMQKTVLDSLRPEAARDAHGVEEARVKLAETYAFLDPHTPNEGWFAGVEFSLADCAALPALFYADTVVPMDDRYSALKSYLDRLKARPSVTRVLKEAEPYFAMFPLNPKPRI